jgi:hypothetical protein
MCMFCRSLFVLFVLFLLSIVLSVLLRYTDSDCSFGIFKLFLLTIAEFCVTDDHWYAHFIIVTIPSFCSFLSLSWHMASFSLEQELLSVLEYMSTLSNLSVLHSVFLANIFSTFARFTSTTVLHVWLLFPASNYPIHIFKLFLLEVTRHLGINVECESVFLNVHW